MRQAAAQQVCLGLVDVVLLQVQQGGVQAGLGANALLVLHGGRDVARQHQEGVGLARDRGFAGDGQLEMPLAQGQRQRDALAAAHARAFSLRQCLETLRGRRRRQRLVQRFSQQLGQRGHELAGLVGVHREVHPLAVHLEQQVGQRVQRGPLPGLGGAQVQVRDLHRFHEQAAVQEAIGQDLVEVAGDVVHIGHVGVEREEDLAHGHGERCQRQVRQTELARMAQVHEKAHARQHVRGCQRVFETDLEGREPCLGREGAGQPLRMPQQHVVHCAHQQRHPQQPRVARAAAQPFIPAVGP